MIGAGRRPGKARHHARQVVAAIEPVLELDQVSLRVLALHGVVGAPKRRFDVADDGVQPDEFLDANGSLPAAGYDRGVQAAGGGDRAEARQTVAVDLASRGDAPANGIALEFES